MEYRIFFIILTVGIVTVVLFDLVASWIAKKYDLGYAVFSIVSIFIYLCIGYFGAKYVNQTASLTLAGLVSLVDTLVGWQVLRRESMEHLTEEEQALIGDAQPSVGFVVFMTLMSMGLGWLGALLV